MTGVLEGEAEIVASAGGASGSTVITVPPVLAFLSNRDGNTEIYAINMDGSGVRNLSRWEDVDLAPDWSPDGERIAFASDREGNMDVYLMRPDVTGVTRLTDAEGTDIQQVWRPRP